MNSIYYFNINFSCNNKCVFCFSHNTGKERRDIDFIQFAEDLKSVSPDKTDKIIINGGEPSLHPDFYKILNFIETNFCTKTIVYTNGTLLKINNLKDLKRTFFVIPIHGTSKNHNEITRNEISFDQTILHLQELQMEKIPYAIKFILNKAIVESEFQIHNFLQQNSLHPNKIFLARMNKTKIAEQNSVQFPLFANLQKYLKMCFNELKNDFELIFLDIPLCFILKEGDDLLPPPTPTFFYSDYRKRFVKKNYYKEIKILGDQCEKCPQNNLCSILQNSYLTLGFQKKWELVTE